MKPVVIVLAFTSLVLLVSACSSNRSPGPRLGEPELRDPAEPWFCEPGVTQEEWQCIQNEAVAKVPEPTRPSPKRPQRQPAIAATPQVTSQQTASRERTAATVTPEAKSSSLPASSAADRSAENAPEYVSLAYRPAQPKAILDLPKEFSAVQLVALSSREALEKYASKSKMRGMSAARILRGDKLFYILLLGIYETRERAERAIVDLPPPFDVHTPWIRSVDSIQKAMLAADRHVGDR